MKEQWDEDDTLEDVFEPRRVDGGSLQADAMQKVLDLIAHERMSQDENVEGLEEKKKSERMVH